MSEKIYRVVHYINQFFAGEGGEESAGVAPHKADGPIGPGRLLEDASEGALQVIGTVICGDNRAVEDPEAINEILSMTESYHPDAFVAGPAFLAGRYGETCAEICKAVQEKLSIPVITGLAPAHPAVERFRASIDILQTGGNAAGMRRDMGKIAAILTKRLCGIDLPTDEQEALYKRGLIGNALLEESAARRGVDMLLAKFRGDKWHTEIPMPTNELAPPAPPVQDKPIKIALITDGGIMLKGNPEKMPSGRCTRYYKIGLDSHDAMDTSWLEVNHFGYDTRYVSADPHRLVPYDVVRELEKAGEVALHPYLFTFAGVATAADHAAAFGADIAKELKEAGIQAAILTST
jgi:glycine reductase